MLFMTNALLLLFLLLFCELLLDFVVVCGFQICSIYVIATMALHNYIRRYSERDRHFDDPRDFCEESDNSDDDDEEYQNYQVEGLHEIEALRNRIAASLMNASN